MSRLFIFLLMVSVALANPVEGGKEVEKELAPTNTLGIHPSATGKFKAILRLNAMGGGVDLFVMKKNAPLFHAADVSSIVWIKDCLIYSAGPLYGQSGVFLYNASLGEASTLRPGKDNEYFELKAINPKERKLEYFYSSDVGSLDVERLRASPDAVQTLELPSFDRP
jgi:hypothetical protein